MREITCDMCMDLMPLVQDGVASEDSVLAVEEHIQKCPKCKAMFEGELHVPSSQDLLNKIQRKTHTFMAIVLMFGVFFGLSLTATSELFLNALIMPFIGAICYYLYKWKAMYITVIVIFVTHFVLNLLGIIVGVERLDLLSLLMWSSIYSAFAILGVVIAGLIHFGVRREK
ncbi:MAG: zf-HC2 domain-containing protein [Erysipelotrichales bacterium]|nr:zf-HC2 domain-containing protein [Erysipelotrichales bacterium]